MEKGVRLCKTDYPIPISFRLIDDQALPLTVISAFPNSNLKHCFHSVFSFELRPQDIAPTGSADMVLTFRNVHNWYMRQGDEGVLNAFQAFNKALKPGGVLGVVEHRLPEHRDNADQKSSGYMKQSYVVDIAKQAGFELVAQSDVNARKNITQF